MSELVGVPGIEPGLYPPHGYVLPLYYTPLTLPIIKDSCDILVPLKYHLINLLYRANTHRRTD